MAQTLQHRRAITAALENERGSEGEVFMDTTKKTLVAMDGITLGGHPMAKESAIPINISQLNNDAGYITSAAVFSGSYNDLTNTPTIPADISDLTDTGGLLSVAPSLGNWTFSSSVLSDGSTGNAVIQSSDFAGSKLILRTQGPSDKDWIFDQDGGLTLPVGGDIFDSTGTSVLGSGTANTGNITFADTTISAPDDDNITIQALDSNSNLRSRISLTPDIGAVSMRGYSSEDSQSFNSGDWNTATWASTGFGGGRVTVVNAAAIYNFIDGDLSNATGVTFSINGGTAQSLNSFGFNTPTQTLTIDTDAEPDPDPTTVTEIEFFYTFSSSIGVDYDDGVAGIIARGDMNVDLISDRDIGIRAGDDIRIEGADSFRLINTSTTDPIRIITDDDNIGHTWAFEADGTLIFPNSSGSVIPSVSDGGGLTVQAEVDLELKVNDGEGGSAIWSFEPDGGIVFPDDTVQTTAWTGSTISVANGSSFMWVPIAGGDIVFSVNGDSPVAVVNQDGLVVNKIISGATSGLDLTITTDYNSNMNLSGDILIDADDQATTGGVVFLGSQSGAVSIGRTSGGEIDFYGNVEFNNGTTLFQAGNDVTFNTTINLNGAIISTPVSPAGGTDLVGEAATIIVTNSPNLNWNTIGVFANGINFSFIVDGSGNATVSINDGGTGHTVGETFTVTGNLLGGTTPADDANFEITAIVESRTALSLTKQVQILEDGFYTLADGTEGQIMYFVPASGTSTGTYVVIDNARIIDVGGTDLPTDDTEYSWTPFFGESEAPRTIAMAIFADGAWCLRGGVTD